MRDCGGPQSVRTPRLCAHGQHSTKWHAHIRSSGTLAEIRARGRSRPRLRLPPFYSCRIHGVRDVPNRSGTPCLFCGNFRHAGDSLTRTAQSRGRSFEIVAWSGATCPSRPGSSPHLSASTPHLSASQPAPACPCRPWPRRRPRIAPITALPPPATYFTQKEAISCTNLWYR